jgi:hypothetical protein
LRKILFTYWHQGFDQAPDIIRACTRMMQRHHPDWRIHFLDAASVSDWIDPIPISKSKWEQLQLPHRSDLIRTQLLLNHGGVWADPTLWFCRSLDDWLPDVMNTGLFLFSRPGPDRIISNWFISAEKGQYLLQRLYEALCAYWEDNDFSNLGGAAMNGVARALQRISKRSLALPRLWLRRPIIRFVRAYPYMIYHYLFYDLICTDRRCREIWEAMPKVSADGPHRLLRHGLDQPMTPLLSEEIEQARQPLYKLTWKLAGGGEFASDSVLAHLRRQGLDAGTAAGPAR